MTDPNKTVFISYRRSTSKHLARSIFMDLRDHGWDAFFDVNTIDSGMFDHIVLNQIAARVHFVLVLSRGALKRCINEDDWLRREIGEAMRLRRNIVLIAEEGFNFEREKKHLPESLKDLPRYNAIPFVHFYFDAAMETLRNRFLKHSFYNEVVPTPTYEAPIVEQKILEAVEQQMEKGIRAPSYRISAVEREEMGDLDGAIADYSEAIKLKTDDSYLYYRRGLVRKENGDLRGAIADYTKTIRLDPDDAVAYYERGVAQYDKKDYERAITDFTKSINLYPDDHRTYNARGRARIMTGDIAGALVDYSEAIRLDPNYADAFHNRGFAYCVDNDYDKAIADFNIALTLDHEDITIYRNRGATYWQKGDPNSLLEAITDLQKYLDLGGGMKYGDQERVESIIAEIKEKLGKNWKSNLI